MEPALAGRQISLHPYGRDISAAGDRGEKWIREAGVDTSGLTQRAIMTVSTMPVTI